MYDVVANALTGRGREPEGLQRMIAFSIGAHILFTIGIVFVPSS